MRPLGSPAHNQPAPAGGGASCPSSRPARASALLLVAAAAAASAPKTLRRRSSVIFCCSTAAAVSSAAGELLNLQVGAGEGGRCKDGEGFFAQGRGCRRELACRSECAERVLQTLLAQQRLAEQGGRAPGRRSIDRRPRCAGTTRAAAATRRGGRACLPPLFRHPTRIADETLARAAHQQHH